MARCAQQRARRRVDGLDPVERPNRDRTADHGIELVDSEDQWKEWVAANEAKKALVAKGEGTTLDLTRGALEKTNDPVRMYLREMGTVPLLTRKGEVAIARRIERGERRVLNALSRGRRGYKHQSR